MHCACRCSSTVGVLTFAAVAGCVSEPAFVVLTISDPDAVATHADTLAVGESLAELTANSVDSLKFPTSITITAPHVGDKRLWVEARNTVTGQVLGRGETLAHFQRRGTPTAAVLLAPPCNSDADCQDAVYCDGGWRCQAQQCVRTDAPCASNFDCVQSTCLEEAKSCYITVDHSRCAAGSYCDPSAGCVTGPACTPENLGSECQDGSVCNGVEQCLNYHCVAGTPPVVNDADACTLDGCDDNRVALGEAAVFHIALASFDGRACTQPGSGDPGVCVATKQGCVPSECGDGVVFADAGELCDDGPANQDDWQPTPHCNSRCSGLAPYCGDGHVDAAFESCDDGDARDTANGCSSSCTRNDQCGDNQVQNLFETCDDGDTNECNGCLATCQPGCICGAPAACSTGLWCSDGHCLACNSEARCGPSCVACGGTTPTCANETQGCVCVSDATIRGSCSPSTHCADGSCTPCDTSAHCGPECLACEGDTPVCGGAEIGCIVDPATSCTGKPDFTLCQITTVPDRDYDICTNGLCVSPGCGDVTCNTRGPGFGNAELDSQWRYPDTGQQYCFLGADFAECPGTAGAANCASTPYCGQDMQYGWDAAHASSADRWQRTTDAEPTVLDLVTGLVWQGCPAGKSGSACATGGAGVYTQSNAVAYCDALTWHGYRDWRLPDLYELSSLQNLGTSYPTIDTTAFPATPAGGHWTATASYMGSSVSIDFAYAGISDNYHNYNTLAVRCVRSGLSVRAWSQVERFDRQTTSVANQSVVLDHQTNLMWQGCLAGKSGAACELGIFSSMTWQAALAYCEALSWGGYSDWRLPNRLELLTVYDLQQAPRPINPTMFPNISYGCWSSTTYLDAGATGNAWKWSPLQVISDASQKSNALAVLCVR